MVRKLDPIENRPFLAGTPPRQYGFAHAHMLKLIDPFRFVLISLSGWMNQHHLQMIDYLREENRVLKEQLGCAPNNWLRINNIPKLFSFVRKTCREKSLSDSVSACAECNSG
jgi:hypothetical protein